VTTFPRRILDLSVVGALAIGAACAPPPKVAPSLPPPTDLVVLMPDPDDGRLGRATVTAGGTSVELAAERDATQVVPGRSPGQPSPLAADDVSRIFADALAARPLPPRQFLLYFQTGSNDLTPESRTLLPEIVAFVRARPVPDVTIIGHTDTTGDSSANAQLGLSRANLIRGELLAAGLTSGQLEVTSHGESDLLVPTADNVAEPRNRRVEVTVR